MFQDGPKESRNVRRLFYAHFVKARVWLRQTWSHGFKGLGTFLVIFCEVATVAKQIFYRFYDVREIVVPIPVGGNKLSGQYLKEFLLYQIELEDAGTEVSHFWYSICAYSKAY
jgi:hypothetical protein